MRKLGRFPSFVSQFREHAPLLHSKCRQFNNPLKLNINNQVLNSLVSITVTNIDHFSVSALFLFSVFKFINQHLLALLLVIQGWRKHVVVLRVTLYLVLGNYHMFSAQGTMQQGWNLGLLFAASLTTSKCRETSSKSSPGFSASRFIELSRMQPTNVYRICPYYFVMGMGGRNKPFTEISNEDDLFCIIAL